MAMTTALLLNSVFSTALILSMLFINHVSSLPSSPHPPPSIKAAYWPSWESNNFTPMDIDTSLFTHLYYAFLMLDNTTSSLLVDQDSSALLANFTATLCYHKKPKVKTILSLGGGGADATIFAHMASSAASRRIFINSCIQTARKYGFDGLDLDWESPANPKEMHDLSHLLEEWRVEISNEATTTGRPPLLLTAAVYFSADFFLDKIFRSYPVDSMKKNLDWVNAMCFDYYGSWNTSFTGAHAALFDLNSKLSTSYGLQSWIKAGLPKEMLVMGLPLYGRTWLLEDNRTHGLGAPAVGVGPGYRGELSFSKVMDFNKQEHAKVVFDAATVSTYSYAGKTWIGYDGPLSTTMKIAYARAHGLRGYFFWAVSGDKDWKISSRASKTWGA